MNKLRPFRFGVICEQMQSAEEWVTKTRQAEDYGYATFLIRDHFIREPFGDQFAPLIALMAAANATRTLRIGSLVLDNDYRHPVMLAKEAATLDLLSEGRFELGIGAGWLRTEYEQAGMAFESAGSRVSRLEEAIHVLKGLFADQPLTFTGNHFTVTNLNGFPRPVQRPHPSPSPAHFRQKWTGPPREYALDWLRHRRVWSILQIGACSPSPFGNR